MCLMAGVAAAQGPTVDPGELTGRTFQGLRLPLGVTPGFIDFSASKAVCWTEPGTLRADGTRGAPVQRMLLTGDVKARITEFDLTATRAVVWLAPLEPTDPDAGPGVWQVWVYMEKGGSAVPAKGIKVEGDKLPVQGIVKAERQIGLRADRLLTGRPTDPFVAEAERALARRLRELVQGRPPEGQSPDELVRQGRPVPPISGEAPQWSPEQDLKRIEQAERRLVPADATRPIFAKEGVFTIIPSGDVVFAGGEKVAGSDGKVVEGGRSLIAQSGISISFWDRKHDSTTQLTAERAVIFFEPGPQPDLARIAAEHIQGMYLEGNVIADTQSTEGHYSLRSPRVFYSVRDNRAVLIDAVFWTYDAVKGLPLYVRAKAIEQVSANELKATSAVLTNTPFYSPDLSIGASTVTIKPIQEEDGTHRVYVDARDVTLRAGGVPFFYAPKLQGDPHDIPLRDLRVGSSSGSGGAVKTTWNIYSLLGEKTPKDTRADVMLDWYFDRGPAFGTDLAWKNDTGSGGLFGYLVPDDYGQDVLASGLKKDFGGEVRGIITGEHRAVLSDEWSLFVEGSYISDETFVDGYFDDFARDRREFTNAIYLRRLKDNTSLSVLGKTTFNDFISNQYLMQAPGYSVEKYPDVGYTRLADDLLSDHPGLLTYSSEFRLTEMRLQFPKVTPASIGYPDAARAMSLFGVAPGQSIADGLRAQGYSESPVTRFDTRHELDMPMAAGPVNVTPFLAGRLTAYDDDFSEFSANADQPYRVWGSEGVRVSTELQHVDNSVESRMFDLHRIRHIVSPSITVWHADTSVDRVDLPVYDDEVESIAEGTAVRMGVDQTFQTQRGGPGRWRSVDVFTFNTELVVSSGDVDKKSPVGRYFDFMPEESNLGGTFATIDSTWQMTEVLAMGADMVYDFDINQPARTDVGITLQQGPDFTAYVDVRYLNAEDSTTTIFGAAYQLTKKYAVAGNAVYDTNLGDIQSVSGEVRRSYPNVVLGVGVSYNRITNETSLGFVLQPVGVTKGSARLKGLGTGTSGAGG